MGGWRAVVQVVQGMYEIIGPGTAKAPGVILTDHTMRVLHTLLSAVKTPDTDVRPPRLSPITTLACAFQDPTGVYKQCLRSQEHRK